MYKNIDVIFLVTSELLMNFDKHFCFHCVENVINAKYLRDTPETGRCFHPPLSESAPLQTTMTLPPPVLVLLLTFGLCFDLLDILAAQF